MRRVGLCLGVALVLFLPAPLKAANSLGFSVLLNASLNYHYVSTEADSLAGAIYTRSYAQPASLKTELGFLPFSNVYLGFVFDLWNAGRNYNDGTDKQDVLKYQVLAAELGYITGNPRSFFLLSAMVGYPLKLAIESSTGDVYRPAVARPLTYGGRAVLGLRFTSWFGVLLEAGYRLRNLGVFSSGSTAYLPSNASLDFSGFYVSSGVALTL